MNSSLLAPVPSFSGCVENLPVAAIEEIVHINGNNLGENQFYFVKIVIKDNGFTWCIEEKSGKTIRVDGDHQILWRKDTSGVVFGHFFGDFFMHARIVFENTTTVVLMDSFPFLGILENPFDWLQGVHHVDHDIIDALNNFELPVQSFEKSTELVGDFQILAVIRVPTNVRKLLSELLDTDTICDKVIHFIQMESLKKIPKNAPLRARITQIVGFYSTYLYEVESSGRRFSVDARYIRYPYSWNDNGDPPLQVHILNSGNPNLSPNKMMWGLQPGTIITLYEGWVVGEDYMTDMHITYSRPLLTNGQSWPPYVKYFGPTGWPTDLFGEKLLFANAVTSARLWEALLRDGDMSWARPLMSRSLGGDFNASNYDEMIIEMKKYIKTKLL